MIRRTLFLIVLLLTITLASTTVQGEVTTAESIDPEPDIIEQNWPDGVEDIDQNWPDASEEESLDS